MKSFAIQSLAFLLLALFSAQTAQAQWSQSATTIYPSTLTKKVGVGLNNPAYMLHVKGDAVVDGPLMTSYTSSTALNVQNTAAGYYLSIDGNKLQASKTSSTFMYTANVLLLNPYGGAVGVGTTTPTDAKLAVLGSAGNTIASFRKNATGRGIAIVGDWPGLYFNSYYNGTSKSMSTGYSGIVNFDPEQGRFDIGVSESYAVAANTNVSIPAAMSVYKGGNVGIGTTQDYGFKLSVNGSIRAKEIRVQTSWADYVFADDYCLKPLAEVESYIKENKHLPDIQPASEIQENGLDMAAGTTKMMAKIEELTLYLIDQNKRLEQLEKENTSLRNRLDQVETNKK